MQVIMTDHGAEASAMSTENSQLAASAASAAAAEIPQVSHISCWHISFTIPNS